MSFFSIGKNEMEKLKKIEDGLSKSAMRENNSLSGENGNVCSFEKVVLDKEMRKLRNKMAVLRKGSPANHSDDDGSNNEPA
ncbi:MAG: hypothetical protein LBG13_02170 [Holosporales bacterium]|jgi:hypothetical protein|nr:hypothetical protein [Holosporales bacterium]